VESHNEKRLHDAFVPTVHLFSGKIYGTTSQRAEPPRAAKPLDV
jgi:hypothetical protein